MRGESAAILARRQPVGQYNVMVEEEMMRSMAGLAALSIVLTAFGGRAMQADREHAVQLAIETLSKHLKIDTTAIKVVSAEEVDWPDSSLGCPEKGRVYMQVITPGFRVRLAADDRQYEVHTGRGRAAICGGPQAKSAEGPPEGGPYIS